MWGIYLFVVAAWITPSAFPQFSDTTSVILLEYSEPMKMDSLLYVGNYKIKTEDKEWKIYKVGLIKEIPDTLGNIIIPDTTLVALVAEKLPYRKLYEISVANVMDKAGNVVDPDHRMVWFFFNGYNPNRIGTPMVEIR